MLLWAAVYYGGGCEHNQRKGKCTNIAKTQSKTHEIGENGV